MCEINKEFDDSHRIKGALYPYDDKERGECEPQWTKLKAALSDKNITNIAITSSYDTGKTSFLKSFFKKEYSEGKEDEYRFITVPNFDGKGSDIKETDLEKNIINQLLFSENPMKFPDSQINRVHSYSNFMISIIWVLLWIWGILIFSLTSASNDFWSNKWKLKLATIGIGLFISWWIIYYIVHNFYKLSWNTKANFGPIELSESNTNDKDEELTKDLFILYGDEIKYYFKKSKVNIVILEDMDRFNNIDIFQKLRELNKNINTSEWLKDNKKVVFVYTLSDTIFQNKKEQKENLINENQAAESKAKFFDYVISMMPFNNLNSSMDLFKEEIDNYDVLKEFNISDNILLGISFYISDRREIACIVADMDTYLRSLKQVQSDLESKIESEPDFMDKLFAAMIYKNVYPDDFDNLTKGKSNLGYFLQNVDTIEQVIGDSEEINYNGLIEYRDNRNIVNLLSVVWNNYKDLIINNRINTKLANALDYIKDTDILRYLLAQSLIEEDFYEFISPTQFKTLSSLDQIAFIRHVLAQRRNDTDFTTFDTDDDVLKVISLLKASKADFRYVYSSSILESLLLDADEARVSLIIEGMTEIGNDVIEEKDEDKIIESKEAFLDKVINWLYANEAKADEYAFVILGWSLYENWKEYFIDILKKDKYRANAIRFTLDYFAMDGEIESEYDNSLISYLIGKNVIDEYEKKIENSELSEEDKKHVRDVIKDKKNEKNMYITDSDEGD